MKFEKYEGLGNDFVVIETADSAGFGAERVRHLCDRHLGIGADGLLLVLPGSAPESEARMLVLNADGSRPEMCGNGLRCVALHLARRSGVDTARYLIETDAGQRSAEVARQGAGAEVRVAMGRGQVEGQLEVEFRGQRIRFARVSMGNPHAVALDTRLTPEDLDELGPLVCGRVPGGSNVELLTARGPRDFDLCVWERGVGRTLACGTGACAAAVAAAVQERAPFGVPLELELPGGRLRVQVEQANLEVWLEGPARQVFSGETALE